MDRYRTTGHPPATTPAPWPPVYHAPQILWTIGNGRAIHNMDPGRSATAYARPHRRRCGRGRLKPGTVCRPGLVPLSIDFALADQPFMACAGRLSKTSFRKKFQILKAMAKNHVLSRYFLRTALCFCVLLSCGFLNRGQLQSIPQAQTALAVRHPLPGIYRSEIGVKEATGHNDGSRIAEYLKYCGLSEGYSWCAAFVSWCHGQAGYTEPRNAWSPALFPASRTIWQQDDLQPVTPTTGNPHGSTPVPGDVFGIHYTRLQRIAHCGFVDQWGSKYCITVEGNTGPDSPPSSTDNVANPIRAGPMGEGVHRKRRPIRTIYAVARWTNTYTP